MSELLREAEDELRQERIAAFWRENGPYIAAFVVLSILATAIMAGYRAWDSHVRETQTREITALIDAPAFPENLGEKEPEVRDGLKALTLLTAAGTHLENDETEKARALYTKAAFDHGLPEDLRGIAVVMAARLTPELSQDLATALQSIASDDDHAFQAYALLEQAEIAARTQDFDTARKKAETVLKLKDLPQTLYERASMLDGIYAAHIQDKTTNDVATSEPPETLKPASGDQ